MKRKKGIHILLSVIIVLFSVLFTAIAILYRADLSLSKLEEKYYIEESHYLDVTIDDLDGNDVSINIHYTDTGLVNSPVVVLLHGMFSSLHTFTPWTLSLVESGYRVIAIDLPNHGLTGNFSDNMISTRRSAAVVKYLMDELDVLSITIGGNSMGGGVAWQFASEYHGTNGFSVNGLILIDAVFPEMMEGGPSGLMTLLSNPTVGKFISKMTPRFLLKRILMDVYGSSSTLSDATVDRYYDLLRKEGNREALVLANQETSGDDGIDRLDFIREAGIPVLVLWGQEDGWIDADHADSFKSALDLSEEDVIIYEGLGHVPMEENPELTFTDLLIFLDAHQE